MSNTTSRIASETPLIEMSIEESRFNPVETSEELTIREGYAAWSACYDDDGNPLIALEGPAMREWFGPLRGRRALDLGCGTGRHTLALVEAGADVLALDLTPEMLARARRKPRPHDARANPLWVRHALPRPLPVQDATFAIAVLGLVAEHLSDNDLRATMIEVARVLEPGGRCLLSALHPDRTAEGQRAQFIDPGTGLRRPILTYHRTTAEYHAAAATAGLIPTGEKTLTVLPVLADRLPRARPYLGQTLGWIACWAKPDSSFSTQIL